MARIAKSIGGKYRFTVAVECEIKPITGTEFVVTLPDREIKKRKRQVGAFMKRLSRFARRKGWTIEKAEVNVENEQGDGTT